MRAIKDYYALLFYLTAYFGLNLALTLSNKALLERLPFPALLAALHASATTFGCSIMVGMRRTALTVNPMNDRDTFRKIMCFAMLFSSNISISNCSLWLVSVPLHQAIRSLCPVITVYIYRYCYGHTYTRETYASILTLIVGVCLATAGEYGWTYKGIAFSLLGVILASVKTVASNRLMTGSLKMPALDLLFIISPMATLHSVATAIIAGETRNAYNYALEGKIAWPLAVAVILNALAAGLLNLVSFQANKLAGALTMTVCGNVKQALMMGLGIFAFNVPLYWLEAAGILIVLVGAAWYSKVELESKASEVWDS